jgi:hypothetical protein
MWNKWKYYRGISFALLSLAAFSTASFAQTYHVVTTDLVKVGKSSDEVRNQIAQLYLKDRTSWSNGVDATPLARKADEPASAAFAKYVLMKDTNEMQSHWARLKQLRGETPPKEVRSVRTLYRLLLKYDGGFGVVEEAELSKMPPELKSIYSFKSE